MGVPSRRNGALRITTGSPSAVRTTTSKSPSGGRPSRSVRRATSSGMRRRSLGGRSGGLGGRPGGELGGVDNGPPVRAAGDRVDAVVRLDGELEEAPLDLRQLHRRRDLE